MGGVVLFAHATDKVQHGRRRDGLLYQRVACNALGVGEVLQERMVTEVNLVGDHDGLRLRLMALEVHRPMLGANLFAAFQFGEEVEVPHGAAELAVGYCVKTCGLLLLNQFFDGLVFYRFKLIVGDGSLGELCACFFEFFGAQETANDVVMERRGCFRHGNAPLRILGKVPYVLGF